VVEGDFETVGKRAFGILAGYIGGENRRQQKIAMTAPVNQTPAAGDGERLSNTGVVEARAAGEGRYVLSFVMPSKHTMDTLPEPANARVRLRRFDARLMAAHRYSGTWSRERYREHERILLEAVRGAGLEPVGVPIFARYNPPMTPWFLRRNEVLVEVEKP